MPRSKDSAGERIELIIIGAGPSGISTALHLLQIDPAWGERMLVLEKQHHPRPKLCGGGVTRLGLTTLQGLGFQLPLPIPQSSIHDIALQYRNRTVHLYGNPQIVIFHRPLLDAFLAEEAERRGVRLQQGEAVNTFTIDEDGVSIATSRGNYSANAVVAADGSNSITRRLLRQPESPPRLARTLEVVLPSDGDETEFLFHQALFDFTLLDDRLQGYFWNFPSYVNEKEAVNCGVFDGRLERRQPQADLRGLLKKALTTAGKREPDSWQGYPIQRFSPRNIFSQPRLLLVGDAAGADPLFGEGIGPALAYGKIAAQVIHTAYLQQDYSFSTYRKRLAGSYLGRYLAARWFAAHVCYRLGHYRWFAEALWMAGKWIAKAFPPPPPLPEVEAAENPSGI